jgi:hypothetical protein
MDPTHPLTINVYQYWADLGRPGSNQPFIASTYPISLGIVKFL